MNTNERVISFKVKGIYSQLQPFSPQQYVTLRVGAPACYAQWQGLPGRFQQAQGDYAVVNYDGTDIKIEMQHLVAL